MFRYSDAVPHIVLILFLSIYCIVFSVRTNIEFSDDETHRILLWAFISSLFAPTRSNAYSGFVGVIGRDIYNEFHETRTVKPEKDVPICGLISGAVVVVSVRVVPSYTYGLLFPVSIIVYLPCTYMVTFSVVPILHISV
jgi:uncharacterized membrane protein YfcA